MVVTSEPFRLGEVRVDPDALRIETTSGTVHVEPRVMSVLVRLARAAPHPVSRNDLLEAVWGSAVVSDAVLTRCISLLREQLGDDREAPQFIETLSKRGYRLVKPVTPLEDHVAGAPPAIHADAAVRALAVLPFVNRSSDETDEMLADGLTDLLIAALASIASLRVISRTSSMHYKHSTQTIREIAAELNVDHVIEGSVLRSGGRMQVLVQLIDATSDTHRWSATYERTLDDAIALLNEVSSAIAEEVSARLTSADNARLTRAPVLSRDAVASYLRGRYFWAQRTPEALRKAEAAFAACVEAAPRFAQGWSGRADCHVVLGLYGIDPPGIAGPRAREYSERASMLDPESGEVEATRGSVRLFFDWDLAAAEAAFERALVLSPSHAITYLAYGDLRVFSGETAEALHLIRHAVTLSPFDPGLNMNVGDFLIFSRRLREAVDQLRKTLEMAPHFVPGRARLAEALALMGEHAQARAEADRVVREAPTRVRVREMFAFVIAASGDEANALACLRELEAARTERYVSAWELARGYAVMGHVEAALRWLRKAMDERCPFMLGTPCYMAFDRLRSDSRFKALLAEIPTARIRH